MTLPHVTRTPETTDDRQGFIHLYPMSGTAAAAELHLHLARLRADGLQAQGELIQQVCDAVQAHRAACPDRLRDYSAVPQHALLAGEGHAAGRAGAGGVPPARDRAQFSTPTRGGTDGSRLTEMGVPTPNLFTGMQNIHGPLEWISVQDMVRATELCVALAQLWSVEGRGTAAGSHMDERTSPPIRNRPWTGSVNRYE